MLVRVLENLRWDDSDRKHLLQCIDATAGLLWLVAWWAGSMVVTVAVPELVLGARKHAANLDVNLMQW